MTTPAPPSGAYPDRWTLPVHDAALVALLVRDAQLPQVLAAILAQRGVRSGDEARRFLSPSIDDLHSPSTMHGMAQAVERVRLAIAGQEPVLIYGDYDVDGTTAVVLLKTAIEMLGGTVRYHVPHRLREGYGMQREVLERAHADGVRLVISVDTGIRAFAAAETAAALGLDLIVTDHHLPEAGPLPQAIAVLNPNQPGCGYAGKSLCGAGVALKLAYALLEADAAAALDGSDAGKLESTRRMERLRTRLLPSFLKMLAIASVADSVPLLGENRAIVRLGIEALRQPVSPGLRALMSVAQLDPRRLSASDLGFRLGPRINAAGRMDVASDVVELFTTRHPHRAQELAEKLDRLNTERRSTEAHVLAAVMERLQEPQFLQARCIVIDGQDWHRGVIGILASRVVEQTGKPTLVIAHEAGAAHGSGRSVAGFHLLQALEHCSSLFTRFGGHAHAVGFSLPSERVPALAAAIEDYAAGQLQPGPRGRLVACDAELPLDRITPALLRQLQLLEPTGVGNQEPVFVTGPALLAAPPRFIKEQHVCLQLTQGAASYAALGWRWAARVRALALAPGARLAVAYRLRGGLDPAPIELEIVDLDILA
ncbi:MAG TPA: single-stranded-DNA-specific exonuclease RecJ [Acidobacteriaceae bacterium]